MKLSIISDGTFGFTWPRWKQFIGESERLGFAGLFRADHFTWTAPPDRDSLEPVLSLAYLADHSQQLHFGTLVAPFSFRDPVMLARQAMALDDLSGGRMILGVGAGWNEREHTMFGYTLGDVKTRMDRLAEGLEVVTRLIRSAEPVTFEGRFYRLREAQLLPRPQRATPVLVGGDGLKRMLPLVARYADIWNSGESVEGFRTRSALLDELLHAAGRQPADLTRTVMRPTMCWRDDAEHNRWLNLMRSTSPDLASASAENIMKLFAESAVFGSPEYVIERLNAYASAGAAEFMAWVLPDDIEGLALIAEQVLPHVAA